MYWWIITVVCICTALLIQYLCSSKILGIKQAISIKNIALREARNEGDTLDEQEAELKNQHTTLTQSITILRSDIKKMLSRIEEIGLTAPEPNFSLEELEESAEEEG